MVTSQWSGTQSIFTLVVVPPYTPEPLEMKIKPLIGGFQITLLCDAKGWNYAYNVSHLTCYYRVQLPSHERKTRALRSVSMADNLPVGASIVALVEGKPTRSDTKFSTNSTM